MSATGAASPEIISRLWKTSRFLPQTVRLLGTRYRPLFTAYARHSESGGENAVLADAISFIDYMLRQDRWALLDPEKKALIRDARPLRRRYKLRREGNRVSAVERWKIAQWLHW